MTDIQPSTSYNLACPWAAWGAGLEGEALLCEALRARGIAFWPEQQLRAEGFFKTPDVKLQARLGSTRI